MCVGKCDMVMLVYQYGSLFYFVKHQKNFFFLPEISYTVGKSENWHVLSREQFGSMYQNSKRKYPLM